MRFENIIFNSRDIVSYLKSERVVNLSPKYDVILSCVINEFPERDILIITDSRKSTHALKLVLADSIVNPEFGLYPFEIDYVERGVVNSKIEFLKEFYKGKRRVVISTLKGLLDPVIPEELITSINIKRGNRTSMRYLLDTLVRFGYRREKEISERGDFAVKGNIIDIFTFSYENPVRIYYGFDDEIEDVKFFGTEDFRSMESVEEVSISPDTYYLYSDSVMERLEREALREAKNKKDEFLIDSIQEDLREILRRENYGMNFYFKYIEKGSDFAFPTLLDFVGDFVKIIVDPVDINSFENTSIELYRSSVEAHELPETDFPEALHKTLKKLEEGKRINLRNVPDANTVQIPVTQIPENFAFLTSLKDYVLATLKARSVILLTTQKERVQEIMKLYEIPFSTRLRKERGVYVSEGFAGCGVEGELAVVLSDKELFVHFEPEKKIPKIITSKSIKTYEELVDGDLVVHRDFGIGIFRGLTKLDQNGTKEYLLIEYRDGEKLYVPLERIGFVEKYIGDKRLISLNRLSGNEWKNTKEKANESARLLARKLLKIEAERKLKGGFAFKPFPREEQILALSFPYELTEDQQQALEDVLQDMESESPMDRLVCGDVGYGKTEIAVRASLRAVLNGKQVAVLVPTTILALQHERTFQERLKYFPVEVESLSRLTDPKREREVLDRVRSGKTDLLIGTHRILSDDVQFKDLGLLVIDEEQKFGVKHKEKIKEYKSTVDVLTLTATPIPRTLHTALLNLKPVSLIATAPPGRIPVKTHVLPYSPEIIRSAIESELKREGQVFVVHNRIESIFNFVRRIQELVPSARISIAHGKMKKDDIEEIMLDFYEGKIDVLVSTTIIENGLDIPSVNTLIVVGAENFGLAQMYQLRGRIGRSHISAFAYFLYTEKTSLKSIAEERLETIREFSGSGAGIKIAMKDLEIRGAGNLLGKEQHGHMISVGYNMYLSLVEKAVAEIRGTKEGIENEVKVSLADSYYIPDSYISLNTERISYYRRITSARDISEIESIREELEDKFGELPKETENLLKVGQIMRLSKDLGILEVFQEAKRVFLTVGESNSITSKSIENIVAIESIKFGKDYVSFIVQKRPLDETLKVLNLLSEGKYAQVDNRQEDVADR